MQFLEQQTDSLDITQYDQYLNSGGKLTETELHLALDILSNCCDIPPKRPETFQIKNIADSCNLNVSQSEVLTYCALRNKLPCEEEMNRNIDPRSKNCWCMTDQELVQQIFLLSDPTGEKYFVITEKFQRIFKN
ncbi:MAG: hypothetical protein UR34_C0010G0017 [candidate division WS6 bacterium GW2011_GWC1_33_20]|uniref:Uncharacterized protein n=2 Tax=Candidatus Dojkabacteria TaxID=74243 RepID=A0A0G0DHX5_9BACT|nr:MAG: hypothetical protein UR32_C0019G0021 [candidate division WS6 bacterium GW2011_GWE2_33_157]KKP43852.1 MAG: hypothetical protein UR34_C0010G0017 [candidate division WS6 bacterium GW2011_GWC1_33_20]KKP44357.1 MAG: hypothetical protein UR36_C0018G0022 [candidate division WS6 bacterium GW2011_GWF1_33_233]KKP54842.1 MAG: hypothetical protein UR45_C0008G0020 [candidate division WS6 bacterium GW2011_WS6_33_547]KKP54972.1 MAG: hypothetical protein UR47_C0007G0030 [candidate division WS6 bacteriu